MELKETQISARMELKETQISARMELKEIESKNDSKKEMEKDEDFINSIIDIPEMKDTLERLGLPSKYSNLSDIQEEDSSSVSIASESEINKSSIEDKDVENDTNRTILSGLTFDFDSVCGPLFATYMNQQMPAPESSYILDNSECDVAPQDLLWEIRVNLGKFLVIWRKLTIYLTFLRLVISSATK